jgi:GNAT superfamily N-acetyltransferase
MEKIFEGYVLSTDKSKLDVDVIHHYLSTESYWALHIPRVTVERSIANALCFGIYHKDAQIGFARVVTDTATFGYLADVFVLEAHRGKGLSKWMMECILAHPDLQGLRRMMLATRDAHGLYAAYGFTAPDNPSRFMVLNHPNPYPGAS